MTYYSIFKETISTPYTLSSEEYREGIDRLIKETVVPFPGLGSLRIVESPYIPAGEAYLATKDGLVPLHKVVEAK